MKLINVLDNVGFYFLELFFTRNHETFLKIIILKESIE
jgi:hypothetical protein